MDLERSRSTCRRLIIPTLYPVSLSMAMSPGQTVPVFHPSNCCANTWPSIPNKLCSSRGNETKPNTGAFAVVYFSCPQQLGNRMHEFLNDFLYFFGNIPTAMSAMNTTQTPTSAGRYLVYHPGLPRTKNGRSVCTSPCPSTQPAISFHATRNTLVIRV